MTFRGLRIPGLLVMLVLFAVACLLLLRDVHVFRQAAMESPIGKPAPDVSVLTLDGRSMRLEAHGHPLWLNFFATWCPPCKVEMPDIERRYLLNRKDGLLVVGVDQQENPALVKRFAQPLGITFPLVIDSGQAAAKYRAFAFPTSVFIDARGVVRALHTGAMTQAAMDADLATILKPKQ